MSTRKKVPYYNYTPETVFEYGGYKLYWDRTGLTNQRTVNNRPGLILVDKQLRRKALTDVAILNNNNLQSQI